LEPAAARRRVGYALAKGRIHMPTWLWIIIVVVVVLLVLGYFGRGRFSR
jgi:hypothetical protein